LLEHFGGIGIERIIYNVGTPRVSGAYVIRLKQRNYDFKRICWKGIGGELKVLVDEVVSLASMTKSQDPKGYLFLRQKRYKNSKQDVHQ